MSDDVYARAGIPMPEKNDDDLGLHVFDEDYEAKQRLKEAAEENVEAEPSSIDWVKREEDDRDRQLRLKAVELVFEHRMGHQSALMRDADMVYKFIKNGELPEKSSS